MRKPKLREIGEALTALVKGPYTTKFPYGPAPIQDAFRGQPVYHEEHCIGCGACSEVCPPGAISISTVHKDGIPFRKLSVDLGTCVYCGTCVEKCTTKEGITQNAEFDLATVNPEELTESVEKEMAVCEVCKTPFAAKAQLKWIFERIGALAAANWTLMLAGQEELDIIDKMAGRADTKVIRNDQMRILCPECRKRAILAEEWGNYE